MKKITLLCGICCCFIAAHAQNLSPQEISSGGGFGGTGTTLSYTIGQPSVVTTGTATSVTLTQGFQQIDDHATGISQVKADILNNMVLFPNPATSTLNLKFNFIQSGKLEAIIFNSLGQQTSLVQTIDCSAGKDDVSTFNTSALAAANYILYLKYTDDKGNITEGNLRFIISK